MRNVVITQSNYIPWKGYFDSINIADEFVIYDDMQYTRRDWRNRNMIKTAGGTKWLTIPVEVKGKYFQKINETTVSEKDWNIAHLNMLKQNYKPAKCYKSTIDWVENLYVNCKFELLTEINQYFIEEINKFLDITTTIRRSENFVLAEEKTQRLVDICKEIGGSDYYSGPAAKAYMDEPLFEKENIKVHYFDYSGYKEYEQPYPPFEHGVTILDLIMCEGENAKSFLKTK